MRFLIFSDTHFKYLSSIPFFNRKDGGLTVELWRAVKSFDFLCSAVEKHSPDCVLCLGDVFHVAEGSQGLVYLTAVRLFRKLKEVVNKRGGELIVVGGNHDYISTSYSLIEVVPADYHIAYDFKVLDKGEVRLLIAPYLFMSPVEYSQRLQVFVERYNPDFVFAHYDIKGLKVNRKKELETGLDLKDISQKVFVGHVHIPQRKGNVCCVGALYQQFISQEPFDIVNGCLVYETEGKEIWLENDRVGLMRTFYVSSGISEERLEKVECVRLIDDVGDKDLLQECKLVLEKAGVFCYVQKKVDKQKSKSLSAVDFEINDKEIIRRYLEQKHHELVELGEKYLGI